ncbi:unnamed protein product [Lactuca saligna]|uniref:Uncharacterized protein n=1 Tax=Lactuca saligna TaxID=75948 RepID=A0AA36ECM8_LACSI|nr:unnamed protein product [Lactuca saligna]
MIYFFCHRFPSTIAIETGRKVARKMPEEPPATPIPSTATVAVLENHQQWDENDQEVDSPNHLPGDIYFPDPPAVGMPILIEDKEPEEDPEDMEQEPEEDPNEDPEEIGQEAKEEK